MISFSGLYNIISNYSENDCDDALCARNLLNLLSLANKQKNHDLYLIQSWVNFGCACLIVMLITLYKRAQRLMIEEQYSNVLNCEDYAVFISNLPNDYTENELKSCLNRFYKRKNQEKREEIVFQIEWTYKNLNNLFSLINEEKRLKEYGEKAEIWKRQNGRYPKGFKPEKNSFNINEIQNKIQNLKESMTDQKAPNAFIIFSSKIGNKLNKIQLI